MATITRKVDDYDGQTEGAETIRFALADQTWEIDLAPENAAKLAKALDPFINKAREVVKKQSGAGNGELAAIREWAAAQNPPIEVAAKGRIAQDVVDRFHAAHPSPPTA